MDYSWKVSRDSQSVGHNPKPKGGANSFPPLHFTELFHPFVALDSCLWIITSGMKSEVTLGPSLSYFPYHAAILHITNRWRHETCDFSPIFLAF